MGNDVLVIGTGGTIASTTDLSGARVPTLTTADLVARCGTTAHVNTVDAASLDSSAMTLADVDALASLVEQMCHRALGLVITHGTDSMSETALALDLVHASPKPVVLTGAQLPADHDHADGPANLRGAIAAAADPANVSRGVLVHFGGSTLPARGLYKSSTLSLSPFALTTEDPAPRPTPVPRAPLAGINVPILRAWPGADGALVDHVVSTRPDGIVVEALGSGNVSDEMGEALRRAIDAGVPVVIATSVPHGGVEFAYGGAGGGATLGHAGAIASGALSPGQARIALATAIATGTDPSHFF